MGPAEERLLWFLTTVVVLACFAIIPDQMDKLARIFAYPVARVLAVVALLVFVLGWVAFLLGLFGL